MSEAAAERCNRLQALDLLRGLAVAGMILVTSPGSWVHRFSQLDHAPWEGWTLADMVFPSFLFAVGVAWGLSFPRDTAPWGKVLRRTLLLVLLGLFLNALPMFDLAHLRIPGILQRIALCYLLVAAITLTTARRDSGGRLVLDARAVAVAVAALLAGYWALLAFVPVPGYGAGHLDSLRNLPAWIDRAVFTTDHFWPYGTTEGVGVTYDPEGLLSTLPATANVLIGVLAAWGYRSARPAHRVTLFAAAGLALVLAGLLATLAVPLNKRIWTSSFALFSSGFSLTLLALLLAVPAQGAAHAIGWPIRVLGANAILAFTLSQLLSAVGGLPLLAGGGTLQGWGFGIASAVIPDPYLASLACALAILTLIVLVIAPLDRRGVHLRL